MTTPEEEMEILVLGMIRGYTSEPITDELLKVFIELLKKSYRFGILDGWRKGYSEAVEDIRSLNSLDLERP